MIAVVCLVLAAIAGFVTYASVVGVGSMFASTAGPVMAAWTAVELGKYAAMSYSYRNWRELSDALRIAVSVFIVFIMLLTSVGVYAYLGQSYSQVSTSVSKNDVAVKSVTLQLEQATNRLAAIDRQIAEIPNTATSARIRLIKQYDDERRPLAEQQAKLTADLARLSTGTVEAETHVGIIRFLADSFGVTVQKATMLAILAVTLCLDPFAMLLNVLLQRLLLKRAQDERDYQAMRAGNTFMQTPSPRRWSDDEIRDRKIAAATDAKLDLETFEPAPAARPKAKWSSQASDTGELTLVPITTSESPLDADGRPVGVNRVRTEFNELPK